MGAAGTEASMHFYQWRFQVYARKDYMGARGAQSTFIVHVYSCAPHLEYDDSQFLCLLYCVLQH